MGLSKNNIMDFMSYVDVKRNFISIFMLCVLGISGSVMLAFGIMNVINDSKTDTSTNGTASNDSGNTVLGFLFTIFGSALVLSFLVILVYVGSGLVSASKHIDLNVSVSNGAART